MLTNTALAAGMAAATAGYALGRGMRAVVRERIGAIARAAFGDAAAATLVAVLVCWAVGPVIADMAASAPAAAALPTVPRSMLRLVFLGSQEQALEQLAVDVLIADFAVRALLDFGRTAARLVKSRATVTEAANG